MRRPFGKLILMIREIENEKVTLGELSEELDEPIDRIMDALETEKMLRGDPAYVDVSGFVYIDPVPEREDKHG